MAESTQRVVSDGTLVSLGLSIDFIKQADIGVFFDGLPAGVGTWSWTGPNTIGFSPAVPNGVEVLLSRSTERTEVINVFKDGAAFNNDSMDTNFKQTLFLTQEALEGAALTDAFVDVDFHGYRPTNLGPAVNPGDAVSLAQYQSDALGAYSHRLAAAGSASAAAISAAAAAISASNASISAAAAASAVQVAIDELIEGIRRNGRVSVRDYGALGNGIANDLPALEAARDYAVSVGKTLYFPDGAYGINDRFMFADGGNAYFELGAYIKLLQPTTSGGVTSGPYPVQTKRLTVHNLTVDCNNIAGENAGGFGHKVGMTLINYTARNVKHSPTIFGGKALQFEGAETTNVQVIGVNLENCSIGLDFGAVPTEQSVQILVSDVAMTRVDTPIYVNDTNVSAASDNYDQMDIVVNNVNLRNCGKLTHSGAVSTAGGLIVSDRGYKIVVNGLKAVNDRGGFTSTAYGGIGALVRGQGKGIVINNAIIDADMVALFDHNPAGLQSPFAGDIASYVLAENVRHYGNLDYVVKCMPGGGKLGAGRLKGIEIDSTQATLAGIVDTNAGAYNNTLLEVVDRGNKFLSTGLITLDKHLALGNALNGGTVGYPAPSQLEGPWTPVDGSGAGLAFTAATGWWFRVGNLVTVFFQVTYPTTANGASASIGGLPYPIRDTLYARAGGTLTISTVAAAKRLYPAQGGTTAPILSDTSGAVTNAALTGATIAGTMTYPIL